MHVVNNKKHFWTIPAYYHHQLPTVLLYIITLCLLDTCHSSTTSYDSVHATSSSEVSYREMNYTFTSITEHVLPLLTVSSSADDSVADDSVADDSVADDPLADDSVADSSAVADASVVADDTESSNEYESAVHVISADRLVPRPPIPLPIDMGNVTEDCLCEALGGGPGGPGGAFEELEVQCRCTGAELLDVPKNLPKQLVTLIIEDAALEVLKRDSLLPYAETIRELTLVNLENFYLFEPGVFQNLKELETVYIHRAPKLMKIASQVFSVYLPQLKIIRIVNTGLEEMPNLNDLNTSNVLHMIDLERNRIQKIYRRQIQNVKTAQLLLNYNDLHVVEEEAFYGSQIARLSLKGNLRLRYLHRRAFAGLQSLRYIDLSSTSIRQLPTEGLGEIDVLQVQDTQTLKDFPFVYNFKYIKQAYLTYPYHCCAFKFPRTHNPGEFERMEQKIRDACANSSRQRILYGQTTTQQTLLADDNTMWNEAVEIFHNHTTRINNTLAICGEIYRDYHELQCYPTPDAFNPCEDLMGNWALRVPVWFISLSAVIGNLCVIVVIATSHFRLTVSKFLMCNLAAADLCIGIHLLLIAVVDALSIRRYFNYAIDWQEGHGCQVAGFLTIFGNVLSVYTLAVITTERWYTITWAIHLNRRLKLRTAFTVMLAGWICALVMAAFPLMGVSNYSRTSICLPLENKGREDAVYLATLLAFNAVAFGIICVCYGSMFRSIRKGGNSCTSITSVRSDLTVAKRMALLVFTDFACWAPIAFFGMTALLGYPLINVTQTKYLLVFFYPLNSCANPCLYALLTQQYRRDFFILMGRYGLCKDRAERHKGAIGGRPLPYGAGGQYKRTSGGDTIKTLTSATGLHNHNNHHRNSTLTTIVSMELGQRRNSRPYSREAVSAEYSRKSDGKQLNQVNKCHMLDREEFCLYKTSDNL